MGKMTLHKKHKQSEERQEKFLSEEIMLKRSCYVKYFQKDDDGIEIRIFSKPIHFFSKITNKYEEIDNSLNERENSYQIAKNNFEAEFAKIIKDGSFLKYKKDHVRFELTLVGADVSATLKDQSLNYLSAFENADLVCQGNANILESQIVINQKCEKYQYKFLMDSDLQLQLDEKENALCLVDGNNATVINIPALSMVDNKGTVSDKVICEFVESSEGKMEIIITPDKEFIDENNFPVNVVMQMITTAETPEIKNYHIQNNTITGLSASAIMGFKDQINYSHLVTIPVSLLANYWIDSVILAGKTQSLTMETVVIDSFYYNVVATSESDIPTGDINNDNCEKVSSYAISTWNIGKASATFEVGKGIKRAINCGEKLIKIILKSHEGERLQTENLEIRISCHAQNPDFYLKLKQNLMIETINASALELDSIGEGVLTTYSDSLTNKLHQQFQIGTSMYLRNSTSTSKWGAWAEMSKSTTIYELIDTTLYISK